MVSAATYKVICRGLAENEGETPSALLVAVAFYPPLQTFLVLITEIELAFTGKSPLNLNL